MSCGDARLRSLDIWLSSSAVGLLSCFPASSSRYDVTMLPIPGGKISFYSFVYVVLPMGGQGAPQSSTLGPVGIHRLAPRRVWIQFLGAVSFFCLFFLHPATK